MRKRASATLLAVLLIGVMVGLWGLRQTTHEAPNEDSAFGGGEGSLNRIHYGIGQESGTHQESSPPSPRQTGQPQEHSFKPDAMPAEPFTASISAELKAGETLVMGGYRKPDGNYEFTFLTPVTTTREDGTKAVVVHARMLAVSSEFAEQSGMDSLAVPSAKAEDQAEAWSREDFVATLRSASQAAGTSILNTPTILATSGEPFELNIGQESLNASTVSITGHISTKPDGGFFIEAQTERIPPRNP